MKIFGNNWLIEMVKKKKTPKINNFFQIFFNSSYLYLMYNNKSKFKKHAFSIYMM